MYCGFSEHVGMIGPLVVPFKTPCLLCTENETTEEIIENVHITPSYGPLCSLISSIATNEIINYYSKYCPCDLLGKTLMFDFSTYKTKKIKWEKNINCKECNKNGGK